MGKGDLDAQLASLREQILTTGSLFADAAGPTIKEALESSMERLVAEEADWLNRLGPETVEALRRSVRASIERSAAETAERLRDPELWLSPTVYRNEPPIAELDHPNHRAWIAILNAADRLDSVLAEFGLDPADVPDPGGGHFGLQPQTAGELDRRGLLGRAWLRYVRLFDRYLELLKRIPAEQRERDRDEALRRWRAPD